MSYSRVGRPDFLLPITWALVASFILMGCQNRQPSTNPAENSRRGDESREPPRTDPQLIEAALRSFLPSARRDEVIFIAVGQTEKAWTDPSPELLAHLSDLNIPLHKASEAVLPHGEVEPDGRYRGIRDQSGQNGAIYFARITTWFGENEADVTVGRIGGPLNGGGRLERWAKQDGQWKIKEIGVVRTWAS